MINNVSVVVVTYNREKLLRECLDAVLGQTFKNIRLIVVDNHSTDNTEQTLNDYKKRNPKIMDVIRLKNNTGGAGGFYAGIKAAVKLNTDAIWIMDDDTIPKANCLHELIEASKYIENFSYLASTVRGMQDEPMNVPQISSSKSTNGYVDNLKYLQFGLVEITEATFVSLLINQNAVKKIGLPWPDFFLWGDDSEYTYRLTHFYGPAYVVGKSEVIHKRKAGNGLNIFFEDNINRMQLYYYFYRNSLIRISEYGTIFALIKRVLRSFVDAWTCLLNKKIHYGVQKFLIIHKAVGAYVFGKYDKDSFKKRFDNEI